MSAALAVVNDMPKLAIVTYAEVPTQKLDPVDPVAREQARVRMCCTVERDEGCLSWRMSEQENKTIFLAWMTATHMRGVGLYRVGILLFRSTTDSQSIMHNSWCVAFDSS